MKELQSKRYFISLFIVLAISIVAFIVGSFVDYDAARAIALHYGKTNNGLVSSNAFGVIMTAAIIPTAFFSGLVGSILATNKLNSKFWTWFWRILGVGGAGFSVYSTYDSSIEAAEIYTLTAPHATMWKIIILVICLILAAVGVYVGLFKTKHVDDKKRFWVAITMFFLVFFYFGSGEVIKYIVSRPRPRTVFAMEPLEEYKNWWEFRPLYAFKIENGGSCKSFISGHTSHTGTYMVLVPLFLSLTKLGEKKWTSVIALGCSAVYCTLTAVSRTFAQAHFISDVAGGMIVITVIIIVFYLVLPLIEDAIENRNAKKKAD